MLSSGQEQIDRRTVKIVLEKIVRPDGRKNIGFGIIAILTRTKAWPVCYNRIQKIYCGGKTYDLRIHPGIHP